MPSSPSPSIPSRSPSPPLLEIRGATVRFGDTVAVDRVDLDLADGEVLALLGPSGCGKSTLLAAIAGIRPLAAGRIVSRGVDLAGVPVHRRRFGLMFQDGVLFPHRTVAGNVGYGLRGIDDAAHRVGELLALVGLSGYGRRRVTELSGGEAQRVALARALAPRPALLLLDEPLAALDAVLRETLLADLRRILAETGTAAVFVTHDQREAFAVADRLALMRAGRIVQSGRPADVWRRPVDEEAARFLGCGAVLDAVPHRDPAGEGDWRTEIPGLGLVVGRADRVGLRAGALVHDPAGPIRATVAAVVPAPERTQLTVRLAPAPPGAAGPMPAPVPMPALAAWDAELSVGDTVALRFDPAHVALLASTAPGGAGRPGPGGARRGSGR